MNTDELPAGADTNALIHTEVMGRDVKYLWLSDDGGWEYLPNDHGTPFAEVPDYSGEIADAWLVVEELARRNLRLSLDMFGGEPWWCEFADETYTTGAQATASTAPLAIVRAALKVVRTLPKEG